MKKRIVWTYIILLLLLVTTLYFAFTHGASKIDFGHLTSSNLNILFNIRLPRILTALLAGASLSVSGAFFQASLHNPIADPGIMGISSAASLFQTIGVILLPSFFLGKIIFALAGGFVAFALLLQFQKRMDPYQLIIIGVALTAVFSGIQGLFSSAQTSTALATSTWQSTIYLAVFAVIGLIASLVVMQWGNFLKVGDEELSSLGTSPQMMRFVLLLIAVLLASITTACVGVLAFIGIIVPQIARMLVGHDYQQVIPFSILGGGWFLLLVDTLGRTVNPPNEIAASVLLAIIGGPCMILVLLKMQRGK